MQTQTPRETSFEGIHCKLTIQHFSSGVAIVRISGTDIGEFGDGPMMALSECLGVNDSIDLFIDARDVRGASIDVSGQWARWLQAHKVQLRDVSMLTGSRFVQLTAGFVRRFADLEATMKIYTEPVAFDAALAEALHQPLNLGR
jgi:hypothetical protein